MTDITVKNTLDASGQYYNCKLLSIDAWRDECGWYWNNAIAEEHGIYIGHDSRLLDNTRRMLAWMREQGFLTEASKGKVTIDWHNEIIDGLLVEVCCKSTGEPIVALSSIHTTNAEL